ARAAVTTSSLLGIGVAQHGVLARQVRLAAKVQDVGEPAGAGGKPLVAAGIDAELVANLDREGLRQEQRDPTARLDPVAHLAGAPGIGTGLPGQNAAGEPAVGGARLIDGGVE